MFLVFNFGLDVIVQGVKHAEYIIDMFYLDLSMFLSYEIKSAGKTSPISSTGVSGSDLNILSGPTVPIPRVEYEPPSWFCPWGEMKKLR